MRLSLAALLLACTFPACADQLTIERLHADPALSGPGVRQLQVAPDGSRVTFLRGRPEDQFQLDLWEFNLHDKSMRRLVDSRALVPEEKLSDAEKARRERERTASFHGIAHYDWSPDGKQMLVTLAGKLYLVDAAQPDAARLVTAGDVIDPQISPKGHYVSFVRDQNLFVLDLASGAEKQLTRDGGGTVHNAEAEFVAQEEMDQTSGYWWAPDDSAIAYKRFDEAKVPVARRFEIYPKHTEVVEQRYPAAGDPNVDVGLAVVSPTTAESRSIDLGADKDIYLVRADWSSDAHELVFQRELRNQKQLDLVAVDAKNLAQHLLFSETSPTWIQIGENKPVFLEHSKAFLWSSERSGRRHLYLYSLDGKLLHAVTQGEWGIDDLLAVDEKTGRVYVSSNRDAVIDKQVYALALDGSTADKPKRITQADGWHEAKFARHGETFVDTWSDPDTPPQVSVRNPDGSLNAWLAHNELNDEHPYAPYRAGHLKTEFGTMQAIDGQVMHYSLIKPKGFDAGKRYPVFVEVYGGPHAQTVERRWGGLFENYMAQRGYVVFRLDNRGSYRRERKFTDVIYRSLGQHEVEDQLRGVSWLAQQSYVDPKRIGVFGWSYGGYMTLRLLEEGSDKIAAGAAVAPVTDWKLYDTHYTEQFLDKPKDDIRGYAMGDIHTTVGNMHSALLLVHGMADDNVLFLNSTKLMADLQDHGILFDLMTYPGAKHGISGESNQDHVFRTIARFFDRQFGTEAAK
jgi:dipeptidyl-peptidase-4